MSWRLSSKAIQSRAFFHSNGEVKKRIEYLDQEGKQIPITDIIEIPNLHEIWTRPHTEDSKELFTLLTNKIDIAKAKDINKEKTQPKWHVYYKAINVSKIHIERMVKLLKYDIKDVDKIKAFKNKNGYYTLKFTNTRGD